MKKRDRIRNILKRRILVLDGATGTELQKRGMPGGVCPELWCLENPTVIQEVQNEYRAAGSDIVYTCTFGGNRFKLAEFKAGNVREVNRDLARISRKVLGPKTLMAGDIGPTGQFVKPFGNLDFDEAVEVFKEQARGLIDGGVDLIVIETMMDIQEARAALIAVREISDLFTVVTMTFEKDGRTLNGTDPRTALITLQTLGADAVGCNCSTGPADMISFVKAMKPFATVPLVAKPNAGLPRLAGGRTVFDMDAGEFASYAGRFASAGVNLVGGCCGTTPRHIRQLRERIGGARTIPPLRSSISALTSARRSLVLEEEGPLAVIGEGINPTGRKALQDELRQRKTSLIRRLAREQEECGADLLDVNVGVPAIDEAETMGDVVNLLAVATDLPLVIDSAKPEAIEAALRIYPGRALVNSIPGEKERMEKLLPLAAKYGAMFILLPLAEREIPETAARRIEIIKSTYNRARSFGFTKEDILIDGMVMTAASNPRAPEETLKTIEWVSRRFKGAALIGLSNVSFGMPERRWLNATFLAMAAAKGLRAAIANPAREELMAVKMASDVLTRRDRDGANYIARFSGPAERREPGGPAGETPLEKVTRAVLEGNRDDINGFVDAAMAAGTNASGLVQDTMVPAIVLVGELFGRKEYFLPQLIASAETMKKAMEHLEPHLREGRSTRKGKGPILLATVQGDIHDIGKNIVALMLRNHGFQVIDLGKDVTADAVLKAVRRYKAPVVGLSALMTTTMLRMPEVIRLARERGVACRFILGGAVVTRAFAESLGAAFARDGVEAVKTIERMLS
ncbi:MAG: homocysteine S-methyltransferase family protein [Syntrophales bacterium]